MLREMCLSVVPLAYSDHSVCRLSAALFIVAKRCKIGLDVEKGCWDDISIGTVFAPLGPPKPPPPAPPARGRVWGSQFDIGIPVKGQEIEQNFVLRGIRK